jgi:hypothetical protein
MSHAQRPPALAVVAAVAALFVAFAPSKTCAQSGVTGVDLTVFYGERRLPMASGLQSALRSAGYGDLGPFDGAGIVTSLSFSRWRGAVTVFSASGETRSARGRIGAALTDSHFDLGYDVIRERDLLVSVLGGFGASDLSVDARAPGWAVFADRVDAKDSGRVDSPSFAAALQVVVERSVDLIGDDRAACVLVLGLRGGWIVPFDSGPWRSGDRTIGGSPGVDLSGEYLAVSLGLGLRGPRLPSERGARVSSRPGSPRTTRSSSAAVRPTASCRRRTSRT